MGVAVARGDQSPRRCVRRAVEVGDEAPGGLAQGDARAKCTLPRQPTVGDVAESLSRRDPGEGEGGGLIRGLNTVRKSLSAASCAPTNERSSGPSALMLTSTVRRRRCGRAPSEDAEVTAGRPVQLTGRRVAHCGGDGRALRRRGDVDAERGRSGREVHRAAQGVDQPRTASRSVVDAAELLTFEAIVRPGGVDDVQDRLLRCAIRLRGEVRGRLVVPGQRGPEHLRRARRRRREPRPPLRRGHFCSQLTAPSKHAAAKASSRTPTWRSIQCPPAGTIGQALEDHRRLDAVTPPRPLLPEAEVVMV